MSRLITHGLTMFVATLGVFVAAAIAAWIIEGFGVALIVLVAAAIFAAFAIPPLVMYYDESNRGDRYPDALL
jgi:hypothetical protein